MSRPLHLVYLRPVLKCLLPWAQKRRLVPDKGQGDLGYAFHAVLRAVFADLAPQPFNYRADQSLLAYSMYAADALHDAIAASPPEVAEMLGLDQSSPASGLQVKPFPTAWKQGQCFAFELKLRPVVRTTDGKEHDLFLWTVKRRGQEHNLTREVVYLQWLEQQFSEAVQLHNVHMTKFCLSAVVRRGAAQLEGERRSRKFVVGPDAVFSGILRITDAQAFAALLARGIGRHRAFGYGMLLLKPAATG